MYLILSITIGLTVLFVIGTKCYPLMLITWVGLFSYTGFFSLLNDGL